MTFDMRTIVFISMLFNFIFAISMFLGDEYKVNYHGVRLIGLGFFFHTF